jgi:hypothetical protein
MAESPLLVLHAEGFGNIALTLDGLTEARRRAAEVLPPASNTSAGSAPKDGTSEALLDAAGVAAATGVPASWFEQAARADLIPHHVFGRWIRFDYREVFEASRTGIPKLRDMPQVPVLFPAKRLRRKS